MANDSLTAALLKIQEQDLRVVKDARANYGRYATLGTVIDVLRPALNAHGIQVSQFPSMTPTGAPALTTRLAHVDGGSPLEYTTALVIDRDNMQGMGSAITYARRYALVSIFLLDADEDDDGQTLAKVKPPETTALDDAKAELVEALEARGVDFLRDDATEMRKLIRKATGLSAKELNDADKIREWIAANV